MLIEKSLRYVNSLASMRLAVGSVLHLSEQAMQKNTGIELVFSWCKYYTLIAPVTLLCAKLTKNLEPQSRQEV